MYFFWVDSEYVWFYFFDVDELCIYFMYFVYVIVVYVVEDVLFFFYLVRFGEELVIGFDLVVVGEDDFFDFEMM